MKIKKLLLTALTLIFMSTTLFADKKNFIWSYDYFTMPPKTAEIEYYLENSVPNYDERAQNYEWKHTGELEFGLTRRLDFAIYQVFKSKTDGTLKYDGFKLRSRYRLSEKDKFFVDPLLYLEYIRKSDLKKGHILELKLILSKTIDNFIITYNQVYERKLVDGAENEIKYSAGVNYNFNRFSLGIESKGNYVENEYSIGPSIITVHDKFWIGMSSLFGLDDESSDIKTRIIIGKHF